jgi:Flp pilus assembly protein TadD
MAPIPNPPSSETPHQHAATAEGGEHANKPANKPAASPSTPTVDPARAAKLRAAGLEQLNRGAIDHAVSLLQEANRLDPSDLRIQKDLARAIRISKIVKAKP